MFQEPVKSAADISAKDNQIDGNEINNAKDECGILEDLLGSREDFEWIGKESDSDLEQENNFDISKFDSELENIQNMLFKTPTFITEKKAKLKQNKQAQEILRLKEKALEEEEMAKEAEKKASAFQFDFGHLDAEVHELIQLLESIHPDICPMPNASSTKSIYSITKANIEKLGLKVTLNRLCIIGSYVKTNVKSSHSQDSQSESSHEQEDNIQNKFMEELTRIRSRADSVFAAEMGYITGCFLSYPDYFIVMIEGPELSIVDMIYQGQKFFQEYIHEGSVLFIAGHVLVRYLQEWIDVTVLPPKSTKTFHYDGNSEVAKDNLVSLSDSCQRIWKTIAKGRKSGVNPSECLPSNLLPEEKLIQYCMDCTLLRPLHSWLRRIVQINFGDYTSETWPQIWYHFPLSAHVNDTQIDSLGVLETFEDVLGIDPDLKEFITVRKAWKPKDTHSETVEVIKTE